MISYKNRTINYNQPVYVYKNLTKNCFSIQQKGRVVAHTQKITLRNTTFVVNENGRQRVLSSGRKNVHAKIHGLIVSNSKVESLPYLIRYNPVKYDKFFIQDLTKKIVDVKSAVLVRLVDGKIYGIGLNQNATKNFK